MDSFVIDASVGVKWFFNEESSKQARNLIQRFERKEIKLIVPEFFYAELANVFRRRVRQKEIGIKSALEAFDALIAYSFDRYSDHELSDVALENALRLGISIYDALYIALAEIYVSPLITADEVLTRACRTRFDFILPLSELKN